MNKNKLILGTVQFGLDYGINNNSGKLSEKDVTEILNTAYAYGIKLLDTAEAYGDSQERIGAYHKNSINKFQVITKFSSSIHNLPTNIIDRVKRNIETLKVSSLYCYMFHNYSDFEKYFKVYENDLLQLKKEGHIKKIGVSVYTNDEFKKVLENKDIDLIQVPFNLLDNYNKRGDLFSKAKELNIEIHTRSAFLQGLFFKNTEELQDVLVPLIPYLKELQGMCLENYKINDLALSYVYSQNNIDNVLIGVDSVLQLQSNVSSINKSISEKTIKQINRINVKEINLLNPSNWNL